VNKGNSKNHHCESTLTLTLRAFVAELSNFALIMICQFLGELNKEDGQLSRLAAFELFQRHIIPTRVFHCATLELSHLSPTSAVERVQNFFLGCLWRGRDGSCLEVVCFRGQVWTRCLFCARRRV
jgi:hypothetical protein